MSTPQAEAVLEGLRQHLATALADLTFDDTPAAVQALVQAEAARLWGCAPDQVAVRYDPAARLVHVQVPMATTHLLLTITPVKETP